MSTVEVSGLEFGYAAAPVLRGIDLTAQEGRMLAVIGPSGCGKTTLLRLIAGFERPRSGTVAIGEAVVAGDATWVTPDRRRVGIVPQEGALFPHLTLAENIAFGLPHRTMDRSARAGRVAELVELTGLEGLARRYPRELSGGQQQRVALARALAPRPDVVLLDEPFASLDPTTRVAVRRSVRDVLAAEGATTVMVTHDREEALAMADLVTVLVEGRVAQTGSPCEVYDAPVDARVAALLGEVSFLPVLAHHAGAVDSVLGRLVVTGDPAPGADRVLVRPEQVALVPGGVRGRVVDVDFVGPSARVALRLGDGTDLVVTVSGPAGPSGARPLVGDVLEVGVRGPVHLVAAEPGGVVAHDPSG